MQRRVNTRGNVNSYGGVCWRGFSKASELQIALTLCHKQKWAWKVSDLMCQCKVQIMKTDSNQ